MMPAFVKKSISKLLFLGLFMILLSGCESNQEANILESNEIGTEQAELISSKITPAPAEEVMSLWIVGEDEDLIEKEEEKKLSFITLTNTQKLDEKTYNITGDTSPNCSKIVVNAYDVFKKSFDVYTLASYKYGDTSFDYGISEAWNNLKVGENTYIFRAYCEGDQIQEAITSITYYGSFETSEVEDNLKAIQEELKMIEALKNKLENLQATENSPADENTPKKTEHVFYTSSYPRSNFYYCDTDPSWQTITSGYLKSYSSEAEVLKDYPNKTLKNPCM